MGIPKPCILPMLMLTLMLMLMLSIGLSANQQGLYPYVNHVLTEHTCKHKHENNTYAYAYVVAVPTSA